MRCKDKEGASDEDFTRHASFEEQITPEGKCLVACVQESLGMVNLNFF